MDETWDVDPQNATAEPLSASESTEATDLHDESVVGSGEVYNPYRYELPEPPAFASTVYSTALAYAAPSVDPGVVSPYRTALPEPPAFASMPAPPGFAVNPYGQLPEPPSFDASDSVRPVDADGDGVAERTYVDLLGDGIFERVEIDHDGDGRPDEIQLDQNQDGVYDRSVAALDYWQSQLPVALPSYYTVEQKWQAIDEWREAKFQAAMTPDPYDYTVNPDPGPNPYQ